MTLALYVPRRSPVHRVPAGGKLLALAGLAVLLFAGLYMTVGQPAGGTTVGAVVEGSAAARGGLRVGDGPERLLRAVAGLEYVALPGIEGCCGFGGTFAVRNADVSTAMLADKVRAVLETGAEVCTAGDNSCLMHIGGGLSRGRTGVRTVHIAEILAATEAAVP